MTTNTSAESAVPAARTLKQKIMCHPLMRIVLGLVTSFVPVPLVMISAGMLVPKIYRVAWPQLLAALVVYLTYRWFVRKLEKRNLTELSGPGAISEVLYGLLLGGVLVGTTFGILALCGIYHVQGLNDTGFALLPPMAEMMLVGLSEEIMFRGILFGILRQWLGYRWALILSATCFALGHFPNEGFNLAALFALFAYSLLQAALYQRSGRLWVCIANHAAWNYCVGQIFSVTVSGHKDKPGLINGALAGNDLMTGGAYGVEASVVTCVVIAVAAMIALRAAAPMVGRRPAAADPLAQLHSA